MATTDRRTSILGLAAVLPAGTLTNDDLASRFGEKPLASAIRMSGVKVRRVSAATQSAADLALTAAERMLGYTGVDRTQIDLLIFVSQTPDYRIPPTAAVLARQAGARRDMCDVRHEPGLQRLSIRSERSKRDDHQRTEPLCTGAQREHDQADIARRPQPGGAAWRRGDRDAGRALRAGSRDRSRPPRDRRARRKAPARSSGRIQDAFERGDARRALGRCRMCSTAEHLRMDGPAVFHFSVYKVPEVIRAGLAEFQMTIDDIDLVILHRRTSHGRPDLPGSGSSAGKAVLLLGGDGQQQWPVDASGARRGMAPEANRPRKPNPAVLVRCRPDLGCDRHPVAR